jgi:hypothetical protein
MRNFLNSPVGERLGITILAAIYTIMMIIMAFI